MRARNRNRNLNIRQNYLNSTRNLNSNDIRFPRSKHLFIDSRESVRLHGRENTLKIGKFDVMLDNPISNVKNIQVLQATIPGTLRNCIDRHIYIRVGEFDTLFEKAIRLDDFNFHLNQLKNIEVKIKEQLNEELLAANVPTISEFTLTYDTYSGHFDVKIAFDVELETGFIIDFNHYEDESKNFGPFLGLSKKQRWLMIGNNIGHTYTGEYIPDITGFDYLFIRTPNISLNSEYIATETDPGKKNNILGRLPVNYDGNVMTFTQEWFHPHEVDISNLSEISFEFYFYDGSRPNFHHENISLLLYVEYME